VSGGILVTSALTWPPGGPKTSEWAIDTVDIAELLLTERIYRLIEPRGINLLQHGGNDFSARGGRLR
jgi:hypothetical protein